MKRYLLDTSALLTLRDDEPGAARVSEVLQQAAKGKARCYGCFMSLMEVLYRVWRDETEASGRLAYQQCLALPMEWVRVSGVRNPRISGVTRKAGIAYAYSADKPFS